MKLLLVLLIAAQVSTLPYRSSSILEQDAAVVPHFRVKRQADFETIDRFRTLGDPDRQSMQPAVPESTPENSNDD